MALINRMSRLFTADVHAVLDRIEEPDVLLRQAIREMEEELALSEQRVRVLEHEREALGDRQRKVQAALTELGEQLDVMRQKAELLATTSSTGDDRGKMEFAVGDDEVEVALLRERQKRQPS